MRLFLLTVLAVCFASAAMADSAASFHSRVEQAKKIEKQSAAQDYFRNRMYPAVSPRMGEIMQYCLARQDASHEAFTIISDVAHNGALTNMAHQPNSNTAACFAQAIKSLRFPPPPVGAKEALPIVIELSIRQ